MAALQIPTHLRIQNVDRDATKADILRLLLQAKHHGVLKIEAVVGGHGNGDVYVSFQDPSDMLKALELHGRIFMGQPVHVSLAKQCEVDWALEEQRRPTEENQNQPKPLYLQMRLKNVSSIATENDMLMLFGQVGLDKSVSRVQRAGGVNGDVLVTFHEPTDISGAHKLDGRILLGQPVSVGEGENPSFPAASSGPPQFSGVGGSSGPTGRLRNEARSLDAPNLNLPTHLHLQNICSGITDKHIKQYIEGAGLGDFVKSIDVFGGEEGDAFVTFKQSTELLRAFMLLSGRLLLGQPIKLSLAKQCDYDWARQNAAPVVAQPLIEGNHLRIRKINSKANQGDIRQFFVAAGLAKRRVNVEVISHFHEDAFVRLQKHFEVKKALSMDGKLLMGKPVTLTVATEDDVKWAIHEASVDDVNSGREFDDTRDRDSPDRPRLLHVQNFPMNAKPEELRNFLQRIGPALSDSRCVRKIQVIGGNGDVFITFRDPAELQQALGLDGQTFRGCKLKLSIGKQIDIDVAREQPHPVTEKRDVIENRGPTNVIENRGPNYLRIQNLYSGGNRDDILGFFAEAGLDMVIANIEVTGGQHTEAFVLFQNMTALQRSLGLNGHLLLGQPVKLSLATQVDFDLARQQPFVGDSHSTQQVQLAQKCMPSCLIMQNLHRGGTANDVLQFFSQVALDDHISNVVISDMGDAYVMFKGPSDLAKALNLDGEYLLGQMVRLFPAKESDIASAQDRPATITDMNADPSADNFLPSYVSVQNLPNNATMLDIMQFFSQAHLESSVHKVHVVNGHHREAFVSFKKPTQMITAIQLSGQHLLGQPVVLSLSKEEDLVLARQRAGAENSSNANRMQGAPLSRQEPGLRPEPLLGHAGIKPKGILKNRTDPRCSQDMDIETEHESYGMTMDDPYKYTAKDQLQKLHPIGTGSGSEDGDEVSDVARLEALRKKLPSSYVVMNNVPDAVTAREIINLFSDYPLHEEGIFRTKGTAVGKKTVYVRFIDETHADMLTALKAPSLHGQRIIITKISKTLFDYQKVLLKASNKSAGATVPGTNYTGGLASGSSGSPTDAKRRKIQLSPHGNNSSGVVRPLIGNNSAGSVQPLLGNSFTGIVKPLFSNRGYPVQGGNTFTRNAQQLPSRQMAQSTYQNAPQQSRSRQMAPSAYRNAQQQSPSGQMNPSAYRNAQQQLSSGQMNPSTYRNAQQQLASGQMNPSAYRNAQQQLPSRQMDLSAHRANSMIFTGASDKNPDFYRDRL